MFFEKGEIQTRVAVKPGQHKAEVISATEKYFEGFSANVLELTLAFPGGGHLISRIDIDDEKSRWKAARVFESAGVMPEGECGPNLLVGRQVTVEVANTDSGYTKVARWLPASKLQRPEEIKPAPKPAHGDKDFPF